jgi:hypothetical protein
MSDKPILYILFTMDCEPVPTQMVKTGPKTWALSGRAIEGFCDRLSSAGYPATLFVSALCAEEHGPLLEELAERGIELGLHVHPPHFDDARAMRPLGEYDAESQRALIEGAAERVYDALGFRPRSFRPGIFSASDATFEVLYELGFRQGSLSLPGFDLPREAADWRGAVMAPHHVDPASRLRAGGLPFLELPVTSDPDSWYRTGHPYDLRIENSSVEDWHRPLIEHHLERLEEQQVAFRTVCFVTNNSIAYHQSDDRHSVTVEKLIDYLETLAGRYELVPTTLAGAHQYFRQLPAGTAGADQNETVLGS